MGSRYHTILLPTRPQPDTIAAIFLLTRFGENTFPGIATAAVQILPRIPEGETEASLNAQGMLLLDVGGGSLDHHAAAERTTATRLVAATLGIREQPALAKILAYTERDDFYGKGTVSTDSLDRAFGLSGLIASLNKSHPNDPDYVIRTALPFFEAHYEEELRRTEMFPKEFEEKLASGDAEIFTARQRDKNLKVVVLLSDNTGLPGYLRSQTGGRFDVVAQWLSSGHLNILTRPTKRVDLRPLAELLRIEESRAAGRDLAPGRRELAAPGRIAEIPEWYYDPATNSIQNGGVQPKDVPPTHIPRTKIPDILKRGLENSG